MVDVCMQTLLLLCFQRQTNIDRMNKETKSRHGGMKSREFCFLQAFISFCELWKK